MNKHPETQKVLDKYSWHIDVHNLGILTPNEPLWDVLLHTVAHQGDLESVKILVEYGTDINIIGDLGYTPLHFSVLAEKVEVVRYLLEQGADRSICGEFGNTALDIAETWGNQELIDLLTANQISLSLLKRQLEGQGIIDPMSPDKEP